MGLKGQIEVYQVDKAYKAFQVQGRASTEAQRARELESQQETTGEGRQGPGRRHGQFVQETRSSHTLVILGIVW